MNKITTVNGIFMASQAELNEHVENGTAHITAKERLCWNAAPKLDTAGNMVLDGELTATTVASTTGVYITPMGVAINIGAYVDNPTLADNGKRWFSIDNQHGSLYLQTFGIVDGRTTPLPLNLACTHFTDGFSSTGGATIDGPVNVNGGISAASALAPELPKTGLNAGAAAVMSVLGNVYHLDHVNGTVTTLEGRNVKIERSLSGWCGLSWIGTNVAHKCVLVKSAVPNTNYGGAVSPAGPGNYVLVMSLLSGVNMGNTSTKFGWTGYYSNVVVSAIEDIPGPSFYVDCADKKVVAKNAAGELTELPWPGISLDQVSRLDLMVVPSSWNSSKIYLGRHAGVRVDDNYNSFNRRYLTPQVYYLGEVPLGLVSNDCHYAIVDTCSEQMAHFRVSVIQGINPADYLNVENI